MHAAAFVILLTFMLGPEASALAEKRIDCRDQRCVDRVLAAAPSSRLISRVRVFEGDPGQLGGGATVQAPILDYWLS